MRGPWGDPRTAAAGLVVANAVPLVGVLAFGWDLHSLLVVYWLESGVVALETVAKVRRSRGEDDRSELPSFSLNDRPIGSLVGWPKRRLVAFFLFHYGGFWAVHGLFVFLYPVMFPGVTPAAPRVVAVATASLAAYHVVSYRVDYVGRREFERTGPVTLTVEPYRRTLVLHATILLGAVGVAALGSPAGALLVMVLVKTALDLRGHWREHERARGRSLPSSE